MVEVGGNARAPRIGRRRRVVALAVFVASTVALLATSYSPVQSTLLATHRGSVDLTADTPRATGRVQLDLSAEALPEPEPPMRTVGEVRFSTDQPDVVMDVTAVSLDALPAAEIDGLTFPVGQLCRVAEPCAVEFEVVLELTSPDQELSLASFDAVAEIVYEEVEVNPDGASASWTETSAMTTEPPGAVETASTDPEHLTLDEGGFAVSRHVLVGASEAARSGETTFVLDVGPSRPSPGRVLVTLDPDTPGQDATADGGPIDPFADCPSNGRCERGLMVTFLLTGERQLQPSTFEWHAAVRAASPAADAVPAGAALDIVVDDKAAVTETTPRIVGSLSGSVPGDALPGTVSGGDIFTVEVLVDVSAGALPVRGFSGMPVTALATLPLGSDREGSANVEVVSGDVVEAVGSVKYGPDRSGELLFNPLRTCAMGRACVREVILNLTPLNVGDPAAADVIWGLDLEIAYPALDEVPLGADVELVEERPGR